MNIEELKNKAQDIVNIVNYSEGTNIALKNVGLLVKNKFTLDINIDLYDNGGCESIKYLKENWLQEFKAPLFHLLNSEFCLLPREVNVKVKFLGGVIKSEYICIEIKNEEEDNMKNVPEIKKVIHSGDYTHILWVDGTKTSVKRSEDTPYDAYAAFCQCICKKVFGSTKIAKEEHELKQLSLKEQERVSKEKRLAREKQKRQENKARRRNQMKPMRPTER